MSYRYTLDVRGVRHGIDRQTGTRREPIHRDDPDSTRSYPACGGYVDAKPDGADRLVTCVRCIAIDLGRTPCKWCKPAGSGRDSCEANGRCTSCDGTGIAEGEA